MAPGGRFVGKGLTLSQPNSLYGLLGRLCFFTPFDGALCRSLELLAQRPGVVKGRQCFSTPFGGAFAWSLMRFGRCPAVLKGLALCRRLSLLRDNRRQCFFTPFDGALCWSLMRFGRCPTVLKGLTLCRRNCPHGAKGRQCFSTPFGGAFAWSLMRFGRCPTVLKGFSGLDLGEPSAPLGWRATEHSNSYSTVYPTGRRRLPHENEKTARP
jgi:hypothetical protein